MSRKLEGESADKTSDDKETKRRGECVSGDLNFAKLRRINDQIMGVERSFIYSEGLPGRPTVRHVLFAPHQYNLYAGASFPGITDTLFNIEQTGRWEEVKRQISIAAQAILSAVDVLAPYD